MNIFLDLNLIFFDVNKINLSKKVNTKKSMRDKLQK